MIFVVKKYCHYLLANSVVFFVDHIAIKYIVNKAELSGRLALWVLLLVEFDYTVEFKLGKKHERADHLSQISTKVGADKLHDDFPDERLFLIRTAPAWYEHLSQFLSTQQYPVGLEKNECRKIRVNSTHFALIGNRLYCRGIDGILRRCVSYEEIPPILEACHGSACGGHFSGRLTAQKIL